MLDKRTNISQCNFQSSLILMCAYCHGIPILHHTCTLVHSSDFLHFHMSETLSKYKAKCQKGNSTLLHCRPEGCTRHGKNRGAVCFEGTPSPTCGSLAKLLCAFATCILLRCTARAGFDKTMPQAPSRATGLLGTRALTATTVLAEN